MDFLLRGPFCGVRKNPTDVEKKPWVFVFICYCQSLVFTYLAEFNCYSYNSVLFLD